MDDSLSSRLHYAWVRVENHVSTLSQLRKKSSFPDCAYTDAEMDDVP
jgi:hypothetical protein